MLPLDQPFDHLEKALVELAEVEQAGVFRTTKLDEHALLLCDQNTTPPAWLKWGRHWAVLAAMLGISVIVWSAMFKMQFDHMESAAKQSAVLTINDGDSSRGGCNGDFLHCFNGPKALAMTTCQTYDFDLDGDIDMLDMQTYQQNCRGLRRHN